MSKIRQLLPVVLLAYVARQIASSFDFNRELVDMMLVLLVVGYSFVRRYEPPRFLCFFQNSIVALEFEILRKRTLLTGIFRSCVMATYNSKYCKVSLYRIINHY
jgi:hypothetical protein